MTAIPSNARRSGSLLLRPLKRWLAPLLAPLASEEPVVRLIRQTAREQWRLLAVSFGGSLMEAVGEGATLAVLFVAVELLTRGTASGGSRLASLPWLQQLEPQWGFLLLLGLAVVLQAMQTLMRYASQVANGYFAARCTAQVTGRIHSQVLAFSFPCASHYKVGDLTAYASQGPQAIRMQIYLLGQLVMNGLLLVAYLVVLVSLSPWLLGAAALMAGLIAAVQKQLLPRLGRQAGAVMQAQVGISVRVTEDIQGLRLLHSSGQREVAVQGVQARLGELERSLRSSARLGEVIGPLSNFLPVLAIALIAALAVAYFGSRGSGVLPSLVTFVIALQRLNTRIAGVSGTFNGLALNAPQLARLNAFLTSEGKAFCREGGQPFRGLREGVVFEGVSLRYDPALDPALQEVSFALPKGRMLALVGPSGAGKSSIADLLVGLYAPTAGRILIDGAPMDQLDLASWQRRLGVVSQDTFLFNATLAENIAFGTPRATRAQIEAAAAAAQAAGFIEALPHGYDTLVGERGYRLSGGQRQRISLARAILRDPELLILDEATSALDSQSERLVQEAIERFERNHTVLVIAHRLSTIVRADQILVLDQGRVVERGSHTSLLAHGGLYSQLWQQQTQTNQPAHA
jgi:ATP-binding cassette subfamily B protein/subfamily B ATP-binding cassette protein MsbA